MATLELAVPNSLHSSKEALNKLEQFLPAVIKQYGNMVSNLNKRWIAQSNIFSFTVRGYRIFGVLTVDDNDINLTAELPFAIMLAKDKIEQIFREKLQELLT